MEVLQPGSTSTDNIRSLPLPLPQESPFPMQAAENVPKDLYEELDYGTLTVDPPYDLPIPDNSQITEPPVLHPVPSNKLTVSFTYVDPDDINVPSPHDIDHQVVDETDVHVYEDVSDYDISPTEENKGPIDPIYDDPDEHYSLFYKEKESETTPQQSAIPMEEFLQTSDPKERRLLMLIQMQQQMMEKFIESNFSPYQASSAQNESTYTAPLIPKTKPKPKPRFRKPPPPNQPNFSAPVRNYVNTNPRFEEVQSTLPPPLPPKPKPVRPPIPPKPRPPIPPKPGPPIPPKPKTVRPSHPPEPETFRPKIAPKPQNVRLGNIKPPKLQASHESRPRSAQDTVTRNFDAVSEVRTVPHSSEAYLEPVKDSYSDHGKYFM